MANYNYYIGPWVWNSEEAVWQAPKGTAGLIDLRPTAAREATVSHANNIGFFATTELLGLEYSLIGTGDLRNLTASSLGKTAWGTKTGYAPKGLTLLDLLWDQLTDGSDPEGKVAVKPLMPTREGNLELHLGGHSLVRSERFKWGEHPHTAKVQALLQNDYRMLHETARKENKNFDRKVLDFWSKQYGVSWREFVPPELRGNHPGPLPHETTITESFNTTDGDTLGPDLTWTEVLGDWDIVSNAARIIDSVTTSHYGARAESDLSSADHYAQADLLTAPAGATRYGGVMTRFAAAANTGYMYRLMTAGTETRLTSVSAGSPTDLATGGTVTVALPDTMKCEINGSTLKGYWNGSEILSVTDSGITGNTRTGIRGQSGSGVKVDIDVFEAADLGAPATTVKDLIMMGIIPFAR